MPFIDPSAFHSQEYTASGAYYKMRRDLNGNALIIPELDDGYHTFSNLISGNVATSATVTAPATGTAWAVPFYLPQGATIGHLTMVSGTTAGSALTHQWFGLLNSAGKLIVTTSDDTSTAWAANSRKTLAVAKVNGATATAYTVPVTTIEGRGVLHWFYYLITATTVPTFTGVTTNTYQVSIATQLSGSTDQTSKTTPQVTDGTIVPVITGSTALPWVGASS